MIEWFSETCTSFYDGLTWSRVLWSTAIVLVTFVGSIIAVAVVLIFLPRNYFLPSAPPPPIKQVNPALYWTLRIGKNVIGAILAIVGLIMFVTPGQGILTLLIGVMLLDLPGKRRLERHLVSRPRVLQTINRLRARFGKPPLIMHEGLDEPSKDDSKAAKETSGGTP